MRTDSHIDAPGSQVSEPSRETTIGIVACVPSPPLVGMSLFTVLLFKRILDIGLSKAGCVTQAEQTTLIYGPNFLLLTLGVQDRKAGLCALHETARDFGLLEYVEIAFYDAAEGYWRSVHPQPSAPFDRFLTPQNFESCEQMLKAERQWAERLMAKMRGTGQGGLE